MASNQQKNQTDHNQHTVEATGDAIFIMNFPVFLPPKPDHKYTHTNSYICTVTAITQDYYRSQLEFGPPVRRLTLGTKMFLNVCELYLFVFYYAGCPQRAARVKKRVGYLFFSSS